MEGKRRMKKMLVGYHCLPVQLHTGLVQLTVSPVHECRSSLSCSALDAKQHLLVYGSRKRSHHAVIAICTIKRVRVLTYHETNCHILWFLGFLTGLAESFTTTANRCRVHVLIVFYNQSYILQTSVDLITILPYNSSQCTRTALASFQYTHTYA